MTPTGYFSEIGAPIVTASASRPVFVGDLDLSTSQGHHEMVERIRATAREECERLSFMYPVSTSDNPPCVRTAVRDALNSVGQR